MLFLSVFLLHYKDTQPLSNIQRLGKKIIGKLSIFIFTTHQSLGYCVIALLFDGSHLGT